jgi:hypothetical protein
LGQSWAYIKRRVKDGRFKSKATRGVEVGDLFFEVADAMRQR